MSEKDIITFSSLDDVTRGYRSVAVAGHVRPDGDCIGSCAAIFLYLKKTCPDADIRLYLEPVKSCFLGLPGISEAKDAYDGSAPDLLVLSDVSSPQRIGVSEKLLSDARHVICIDHHISNPGMGNENRILPDASSSCEVVCGIIDRENLDRDIAMLLYLGIVHDTGLFSFPCTSPETLRCAADLLDFGFDAPAMIDRTFRERTYTEIRAAGHVLSGAVLFAGGKGICGMLLEEEMRGLSVSPKELDAVINDLRNTAGCEAAVFIYPGGDGSYKASLRSKSSADVSRIACAFGGGGHVHAAGCSSEGDPLSFRDDLIRALTEALDGAS